jgi:hypothetical protein
MKKIDFFDAIYDKKIDFVKNNFDQLNDHDKASVYYFACSEGSLEIVKWMLEESTFNFDERFYGCTKEEHGFMGACHEGCKPVREYLLKQRNVVLSDNIVRWMYENKLGRLIPKKMKM